MSVKKLNPKTLLMTFITQKSINLVSIAFLTIDCFYVIFYLEAGHMDSVQRSP